MHGREEMQMIFQLEKRSFVSPSKLCDVFYILEMKF